MPNNDQRLRFIVDLIDDTKEKFAEIAKNLNAMENQTKSAQTALKSMEPVFKGMVTTGGVALAAITGEMYLAVGAAMESQKAVAQLNAVLKSTKGVAGVSADSVTKFASEMQKLTNYSDEQIISMSNIMLTFTKIGKDIFPDAQRAILDMSAALGTDLQGSAIQLGKALQDPIQGVAALRRVGVSFTEGQQAFIKSLVESGQQLKAQQYIIREIQTEFGGSAQAIANPFIILKNQIDEIQESIGRALLPAIKAFAQAVQPVVEKISAWIEANPRLTAAILAIAAAAAVLTIALGALGLAMISIQAGTGALGTSFKALGTVITYLSTTTVRQFVVSIGSQAVAAFSAARAAVVAFTAQMTILNVVLTVSVIGAIAAVVALVIYTGKKMAEFAAEAGGFANAIALTFLTMKMKVLDWIQSIVDGLNAMFSKIPGMEGLFDGVSDKIKSLRASSEVDFNMIAVAAYAPGKAVGDSADKIDVAATSIIDSLGSIPEASKKSTDAVKKQWEDIVGAVKEVRDEIRQTYDDINKATADYLKSVGGEQKSYQDSVVDTVAQAQKDIEDLTVQQNSARAKGNYDEVATLGQQIQEKQAILISYNSMQLSLDQQVADKKKYLMMNELQQLQADHEAKLKAMQEEYLQDQIVRLQKMLDLQKEHNAIVALVGAQKKVKLDADVAMQDSTRQRLANEKAGLSNWISETTSMYSSYATSVRSILGGIGSSGGGGGYVNPNAGMFGTGGISGKRAAGGPVFNSNSYVVGENGPEIFTPERSGRIIPNNQLGGNGGGLTVVITGNTFVGKEDIAEEIADSIMDRVKQNIKLS